MTPYARHLFKMLTRNGRRNGLDHRLVAIPARLFRYLTISLGYLYRFVKRARRKVVGMPKTVRRLRVIFADQVMRCMAVVARSNGVMAGLKPPVVLLIHHVTIGTRAGVVAEV